jgi:protein-tyrosine phosphatase
MRILFVCLGNICRSPTAEGVMRALVENAGLDGEIEIDSAGTGGWHAGEPADSRARAAARKRGYELTSIARKVRNSDFHEFDLILAMDRSNFEDLRAIAPSEAVEKIRMLREFGDGERLDVPDPYYGGADGFAEVLDIVERCCEALIEEVQAGALR